MHARIPNNRGFTLIEVLVALAIIAVALTAVMFSLGQNVDTTMALRDRSIALWVAQNRLALRYLAHDWPAAGSVDGTAEMAGREWRWREQIVTTPDADIRRVEVEVRIAPDREALAHLVGFVPKPNNSP